ncbi:MAG: GerMN domain-containing protein [Clostridia bacterium]|nr:GerMN domain-containing protein [Clostridia bacterium]
MKKIVSILLSLLLLSGCTPKETANVSLYFIARDGQEIKAESRTVQNNGSLLEAAVKALLEGPKSAENRRIIPEGTTLLGIERVGTVAEINLSAPFDSGDAHTRLMARYTVIYTACSAEDVQKVKLLVEGQPLKSLHTGEPLGALGAADLGTAMPQSGGEVLLTLYFPDKAGKYLMPDSRKVTLWDGETVEGAVVTEILRGPSASHLAPAVSEETKMISAETKNGICFVDMDASFIKKNTGDSQKEKLAVYAIVNSLCTLPHIKEVRFFIDGRVVRNFGKLYIDAPLSENKTLYPAE